MNRSPFKQSVTPCEHQPGVSAVGEAREEELNRMWDERELGCDERYVAVADSVSIGELK